MKHAHFSVWWPRLLAVLFATISLAHAQVQGPNGHYYEVRTTPKITWEHAKALAEESNFNGVFGHLATITSAEEDQFIEDLRMQAAPGGYNAVWVGGSQDASATSSSEGWHWVNGEGPIAGSLVTSGFSNWQAGEPNDYWGPNSENYLSVGHFNRPGWNDEPHDADIYGYVIEYPNAGTSATVRVQATDAAGVENPPQSSTNPAGVDPAVFTFFRTGDLSLDLPVYFSIHGTAVNGVDYNEIPRSVIIPAGSAEVKLQIVPRKDSLTVMEQIETVGIRLEDSLILTPSASYRIDSAGREAGVMIYENGSETRPYVDIAVPRNNFSYRAGEAVTIVALVDHASVFVRKVEFIANDTLLGSRTITQDIVGMEDFRWTWNDAAVGSYDLRVRVTFNTGAQITSKVSRVNVISPTEVPYVSIHYVESTTTEPVPDADYAPGHLEVRRNGHTVGNLQVFYSVGGTATADADYERLQGYIVIPDGKASAKVPLVVIDDSIDEAAETVSLTLIPPPEVRAATTVAPPPGYNIDSNNKSAEIVIRDNDDQPSGPNVVRIDPIDPIAIEGQPNGPASDNAVFRISRTGDISERELIFFTVHGTAKNGEDYDQLPSTIDIPAGQKSVDLVIVPKSDAPSVGHKYEVVSQGGLTWTQARDHAAAKSYQGAKGHLATITSVEEDAKIEGLRQEAGGLVLWVGGYQEASETSPTNGWKWVNNEGPIPGSNSSEEGYANWSGAEPNDYWGPGSENFMAIGWLGAGWNDQGGNAAGYVVEYDVEEPTIVSPEIMETIGVRLQPSASASPLPTYELDEEHRSAAAVIFDGEPATDGSIEVAIPSANDLYKGSDVEFVVVAHHPMTKILSVDYFVNDVKVGSSTAGFDTPSTHGGVTIHWFKWPTPVNGQHTLQAKATLGGGRVLQSSRVPFHVQGAPEPNDPPVVRILASDAEATEFPPTADGWNPARFLIERTGSTDTDLPVYFSIHGTAKNGDDYERIASPITIPAGQSSVAVEIVPLSDRAERIHKYEIVSAPGISWEAARAQAEDAAYQGIKGHLATITSRAEDELIESIRQQAGAPHLWVGGYQEPDEPSVTEGWKWVNDEGPIPGSNNSEEGYANWLQGEPNDYWGVSSENHLVIGWTGAFGWNDQGANIGAQGYVIEFDLPVSSPIPEEIMETVGIRLLPPADAAPVPSYTINSNNASAAVVIFEGMRPPQGAVEIAIPSAGQLYEDSDIEFLAAAFHPTIDIEVVDFFLNDVKVGSSVVSLGRPSIGGVMEHRLRWTSPVPGQHTLQAKAILNDGAILESSRIPFTVHGFDNTPPIANITSPEDGSVYIDGESLIISGNATDQDGSVAKIEILLDGFAIATTNGPAVQHRISADVGPHEIAIRATDNEGAVGMSQTINILVRDREAVSFVHRELPPTYSPGVSFVVTLRANPPEGTFAYAVEDIVPAGWLVSNVSHEGAFDRFNRKVKFGPFFDDDSRSLTYRITPPASVTGVHEFSGEGSVNGGLYPITGDASVRVVQQFHPADTDQNLRIVLSEVTAYAAAWKAGRTWATGPVPIPLSYVTRAHHIWQRGEAYRFEASAGAAPACWIPTSAGAGGFTTAAIANAQRSVLGDLRANTAVQVQIAAAPASGSTSYAVEERPPHGWTVSNISHEGVFDPATGTIRWGVFADGVARTLTYSATPPPAVASTGLFAGQLSYDGTLVAIGADSRLANSVTVSGVAPISITNSATVATGVRLWISGPAGQTGVVEATTNFTDWTEIRSIFLPNGSAEFIDDSPAAGPRFYRIRAQ